MGRQHHIYFISIPLAGWLSLMLRHCTLSSASLLPASLQQGEGEPVLHAPCLCKGGLPLLCPLGWSCCCTPDTSVRGSGQPSTTRCMDFCWKDAAAQVLWPRGRYELSPSQMLLWITLTIATNSTRGPGLVCAWDMMLNCRIWGLKAFFPIVKMAVRHTAAINGMGNIFPTFCIRQRMFLDLFVCTTNMEYSEKMSHCSPESAETQKHQPGTVLFTRMKH